MTLPLLPIWTADLLGSALMCVFSLLAVRVARRLRGTDPTNVVWTYLLWLCYALAAFALSRSVGHIVRRLLLSSGYGGLWSSLQPYSGAINSLLFVVVASITLFFERVWRIYQQILGDQNALQDAHNELIYLNRNLEHIVEERTRELSDSERKYRRIFEASQDMILMTTIEGAILDMNETGCRMLGIPDPVGTGGDDRSRNFTGMEGATDLTEATGMVGAGRSPLLEVGRRHRFQDFLAKPREWEEVLGSLAKGGAIINHELQLQGQDGRQFSALISAKVERMDQDEALEAIHFLAKDISQRKAMEKQLLLADKLSSIGQLAAGVAHEVNNPLGMILGYTQLLIRSEEPGTQRYDDLRTIEKHTRTCKTIVERLLNFARSTQTRKESSHIHSVIEEVLGLLKRPLELDGILIEKDFDERVPPLLLDREKMRQVFMNLLVNARQAICKQGKITLTTRYDTVRDEVIVQVADSGGGIEAADLTRIFDPFFTTKPTGEGTGLGLSVSYGIVQDHKGQITVSSEPGKGSTFTVVLPNTSTEMGR
jgi:two-component system, NtrC family, sensor kinase